MLTTKTVKRWYLIHKWTSLVCTVFLLMLCITGLPLIFYEEIDHALGNEPVAPVMAANAPRASMDDIAAAGLTQWPGQLLQYIVFDEHNADLVYVTVGKTPGAEETQYAVVDARTAKVLHTPDPDGGVMGFILELHIDMFAGLPGELFLGFMGLLFAIAIVSGVVVYAPFMRKLEFGTVRKKKARRTEWLDLHNMIGVVTLCWAFVVGITGVLNTLGQPILKLWQADQLSEMVAPYKGRPLPKHFASVGAALETAEQAAPGMTPDFVAYPGTPFTSNHHYAVYMRGNTPLTSKLYKPALIDAQTGKLTAIRDMPWYAKALFISQPLHFGDYGGLPMKIVWALLDLLTIVVLGSGIYLWLGKRRAPIEQRLIELLRGGNDTRPAPAE